MNKFLNILKKCVLLPVWLLVLLAAAAVAAISLTVLAFGSKHPVTIAAYFLSAYALTAWCFKIPCIIRSVKKFKKENKYAVRYTSDAELRVKISLYGTLIYNAAYAALQIGMGLWHGSVWFFSLAVYYILLVIMRFFLLRDIRACTVGQNMEKELLRYRFCGMMLTIMNAALAGMMFFMMRFGSGFSHHYITTIAMAAYTFTSFTVAIVNAVRYKRFKSPVLSASKSISLASAGVSMLTLTSAMLNAFGGENTEEFKTVMTRAVGAAVCTFVLAMALYMIFRSEAELKKIRSLKNE